MERLDAFLSENCRDWFYCIYNTRTRVTFFFCLHFSISFSTILLRVHYTRRRWSRKWCLTNVSVVIIFFNIKLLEDQFICCLSSRQQSARIRSERECPHLLVLKSFSSTSLAFNAGHPYWSVEPGRPIAANSFFSFVECASRVPRAPSKVPSPS